VQLPYIVQELSCEEHAVSLRAPGYNIRENMPVMVGIEEDKTNRVQFTLIPMASELVISCNAEEAEVFEEEISLGIVGKVLRLTPFTEHQLEIRATGFSPVWLQVRLPEPGKLYRQHIELETASLFSDLIEIPHARPAPLSGLAPGSRAARERQADAMREWQLPLEVKTQRTGIRMRLVPAGTFTMGGREGDPGFREDEKIASEVTISRPMYVGKYEITQKQWERVMGRNPSSFMHAGPAAPVEQVSWEDARKFVKRLCDMESVPVGTYRLLTEAEWEYCCRAGTETPIYTGAMTVEGKNNAPELDVIAWYAGNSGVDYKGGQNSEDWPEKQYDHSRAGTHAVGQKKPNAWGLYDMIGNVWEWCFDRYNSDYLAVRQVDPRGPSFGNGRVCRGGGWYSNALKCRSARRYSNTPRYRSNHLGVRIAREVERIE
jgi:formylglycine-generating enzyme required for sulfatase activity